MTNYIEPLESELKFRQLSGLAKELKVPIIEPYLGIKVEDKDKNILIDTKQRSHSWTRNYYNILLSQACCINGSDAGFGAGSCNLKYTDGSVVNNGAGLSIAFGGNFETGSSFWAGSTILDYGIRVGLGNLAESFEHNALQTPCAEGTGANQFNHQATSAVIKAYNNFIWTVTWKRILNNNSAAIILVKECGIYSKAMWLGNGANVFVMITRDLINGGNGENVPIGGQLTLQYDLSFTFPA